MESTVKQRLVQFIKMMHLTQRGFEELCGMGNGYINSIRKSIGPEKMQSIIRAFPQLNREWLLYGEGEMLKHDIAGNIKITGNNNSNIGHGNTYIGSHNNNNDVIEVETEEVERAPILSGTLARAPQTDILEVVTENVDEFEKSPIGVFHSPVSLWYRVQDESLAPKYEIGDLIALWAYPKGEEDPIPGKMYGINTTSNGLIIRKLYPQADGGYIARALDRDEFPDYYIKSSNVVQVYKIIVMVRY